ncbi:hypothetical protein LIER_22172 [Lithospermum erythrorhizon]|uniref:Secreted protein n=1 Tax=Lithospermum erythrorhizon TaxID=34254 RepID=A0AAV3QU59_LITER
MPGRGTQCWIPLGVMSLLLVSLVLVALRVIARSMVGTSCMRIVICLLAMRIMSEGAPCSERDIATVARLIVLAMSFALKLGFSDIPMATSHGRRRLMWWILARDLTFLGYHIYIRLLEGWTRALRTGPRPFCLIHLRGSLILLREVGRYRGSSFVVCPPEGTLGPSIDSRSVG